MTNKASAFVLDTAHLGMMFAALGLAYYLPFELVLLSYAILGPLHYLTEISWLHERSYFMPHRDWALLLFVCTIAIAMLIGNDQGVGFFLGMAVTFSIAFTLFKTIRARIIAVAVGLAASFAVAQFTAINLPLIILLPTVVHVSVFTFLFMLLGALRSRSPMQGLLVVAYIVCIVAIFIFPPSAANIWSFEFAREAPRNFGAIGYAFGQIFGPDMWPFDTRLAGFLSFIYTYHYLNWFIKVRVIKWDKVPKWRLLLLAAFAGGITAFYFYDYSAGFMALLSLSLLHVLLEFPLNALSVRELARIVMPSRRVAS